MSDAKVTREHRRLAAEVRGLDDSATVQSWIDDPKPGDYEFSSIIAQAIANAEQRGRDAERSAVVALIDSCIGAKHHIAWQFAWRYLRELVAAGAKADHDQESGEHVKGAP